MDWWRWGFFWRLFCNAAVRIIWTEFIFFEIADRFFLS